MSDVEDYREKCLSENGDICTRCDGANQRDHSGVVAHHIDGDRSNNAIENLETLCRTCHNLWHNNFEDSGDFENYLESFPSSDLDGWRIFAKHGALLTDSERELIATADPETPNRKYQAVSRVRTKIEDELTEDVELLAEHHPELLGELTDVVCGTERLEREDYLEEIGRQKDRISDLQTDLEDCRDRLAEAEAERNALEEQHAGRAAPPERLQEAAAAIERGLDRLPDDAPGRTPLEDARGILEEEIDE